MSATFGHMWNAAKKNEADEVIKMLAALKLSASDVEKETMGIDDDVEREDIAIWFELKSNKRFKKGWYLT